MRVRRQKTVVLHVSTYALLNSFLEDSYLSAFLMGADHLVPCLSEVRVGPCEHYLFHSIFAWAPVTWRPLLAGI